MIEVPGEPLRQALAVDFDDSVILGVVTYVDDAGRQIVSPRDDRRRNFLEGAEQPAQGELHLAAGRDVFEQDQAPFFEQRRNLTTHPVVGQHLTPHAGDAGAER